MSQTKTPFGSIGQAPPRGFTTMEVNGLRCEINMPPATKSRFDARGEEMTQGLARYAKTDVYRVDDFSNCPEHWQRSDPSRGVVSCFMLAKPDHMVWIDLTMNAHHTHHVAALFSAQGVNAVTGQKVEPPIRLEQYDRRTPPKGWTAGNDWPEQNYIATTCSGALWRDGFRAKDGKTREFVFTEDMTRDVATAVIGAEERVEAFGIALFTSKEPKPRPAYRSRGALESFGFGPQTLGATRSTKSLGVGAGAVVNQTVTRDPNRLDFWNETPDALFIVYYVGAEEFQRITGSAPGRSGGNEGFLGGTPVGNP